MTIITASSQLQSQFKGFIGGVWNPEDIVALSESPWIIVSAMRSQRHRGGLLAVRTDETQAVEMIWRAEAESGRASAAAFDPHGIAARRLADGRYELLVIDHGDGEAVNRLIVTTEKGRPEIVAGERIVQPPGTSGNAVAYLPDGGFVLTSMFDPRDADKLSKFARAEVTGGVWQWSAARGWSRFGNLGLSGANGIAAAADGSMIIVCEWAAKRIWRLKPDGQPDGYVATSFLPDNVRWTPDGRLTHAGQVARPEAVFGCEARGEPCPLGFDVVTLDPNTLGIAPLVRASENDAAAIGFGGATGALVVGDALWVGSFTGERIATFAFSSCL